MPKKGPPDSEPVAPVAKESFNPPKASQATLAALMEALSSPQPTAAAPRPIHPAAGIAGAILGALDPEGYERQVRPMLNERRTDARRDYETAREQRGENIEALAAIYNLQQEDEQEKDRLADIQDARDEMKLQNIQRGALLVSTGQTDIEVAEALAKELSADPHPYARQAGRLMRYQLEGAKMRLATLTEKLQIGEVSDEDAEEFSELIPDVNAMFQSGVDARKTAFLHPVEQGDSPEKALKALRLSGQATLFESVSSKAASVAEQLHVFSGSESIPPDMRTAVDSVATRLTTGVDGVRKMMDGVQKAGIVDDKIIDDLSSAMDQVTKETQEGQGLITQFGKDAVKKTNKIIIQNQKVQRDLYSEMMTSEYADSALALLETAGSGPGDIGGPVAGLSFLQTAYQAFGGEGAKTNQKFATRMTNVGSSFRTSRSGKNLTANEIKIDHNIISMMTSTYTKKLAVLNEIKSFAEGNIAGIATRFDIPPDEIETLRATVRNIVARDLPAEQAMRYVQAQFGTGKRFALDDRGDLHEIPEGVPDDAMVFRVIPGAPPVFRTRDGRFFRPKAER